MPQSQVALSSLVMDFFLFLTNCHHSLFPRFYFHKWKIILHCLNGTKESYYFTSDPIELHLDLPARGLIKTELESIAIEKCHFSIWLQCVTL